MSKNFENTYNFNFYIFGEDSLFTWCKEETIFGAGVAENWINNLQDSSPLENFKKAFTGEAVIPRNYK